MIKGQNQFERLLAWLDADPAKAGVLYGRLHRKLAAFYAGRGCGPLAEELADETFDRVSRKLEIDPGAGRSNPSAYVFGFARNIVQEYQRRPKTVQLPDSLPEKTIDTTNADRIQCLTRCIAQLTPEEQETITDYYAYEKRQRISGRRDVASDLQKSQGALRVQAHRLRRKLLDCMNRCLGGAGDVTFPGDRIRNK